MHTPDASFESVLTVLFSFPAKELSNSLSGTEVFYVKEECIEGRLSLVCWPERLESGLGIC